MSNITRFQFEQMQARLARPASPPLPPNGGEGRGEGTTSTSPLEKELHRQIMDYCDAQWPRWKYVHSRMDKSTRNEPGVPDFAIFLPENKKLVIEAKRPGEKLSPAQRDWHAEMDRLGHTVHLVYSFDDFLSILRDLGQQGSKP